MLDELLARDARQRAGPAARAGLGPEARGHPATSELSVNTLDELRAACEAHRVRELKGFGDKTEDAILEGLDFAAEAGQRMLWADADEHVQAILAHMRGCAGRRADRGGRQLPPRQRNRRRSRFPGRRQRRRRRDGPSGRLSAAWPKSLARGDTKMSVRLASGLQVDLRVVPAESFGAALQYFTGSKAHNIVLRGLAKDRGLKINEYGVFRGEKPIAGRTEEEVYAALDLPCFPPELREARREFDWADAGKLPKLVELDDIRGDLHMHSTWTDGLATIEEMAEAAQSAG